VRLSEDAKECGVLTFTEYDHLRNRTLVLSPTTCGDPLVIRAEGTSSDDIQAKRETAIVHFQQDYVPSFPSVGRSVCGDCGVYEGRRWAVLVSKYWDSVTCEKCLQSRAMPESVAP
jgi:hypothetical protein